MGEHGRSEKDCWQGVFAKAMQGDRKAFEELWEGYLSQRVRAWAQHALRGKSYNLDQDCQDVVSTIFARLFEHAWYRHLKNDKPYTLTKFSLIQIQREGIPDDLAACLRQFENQGFPDKDTLLQAVKHRVGESCLFETYRPLIQRHIQDALGGFCSYLWKMTRNECIRILRMQQRVVLSEKPHTHSPGGYAVQPGIEHRERFELVCEAIQRITNSEERRALEMRIFQELSFREISEKTGKPIQTLHSQYEKYMKQFRNDPKLREYWKKAVATTGRKTNTGTSHEHN